MLSTKIRSLFKRNRYEIMHLLNRRGTKIDVQWEVTPGASLLEIQAEMRAHVDPSITLLSVDNTQDEYYPIIKGVFYGKTALEVIDIMDEKELYCDAISSLDTTQEIGNWFDALRELRRSNRNKYLLYLHQATANQLAVVTHPRRVAAQ